MDVHPPGVSPVDSAGVVGDSHRHAFLEWAPLGAVLAGAAGALVAGLLARPATLAGGGEGGQEDGGVREIVSFARDYHRLLVASRPTEGSCVHILDGRRPEFPVGADGLVRSLSSYSDPGLLDLLSPPVLDLPRLFGPEPDHGWCYFYQQASLARQRGDWDELVRLAEQTKEQGLRPSDRSEWLPFLEGYAQAGQIDQARQIASHLRDRESIRHDLCDRISNVPTLGMSDEAHETVVRLLCEFE